MPSIPQSLSSHHHSHQYSDERKTRVPVSLLGREERWRSEQVFPERRFQRKDAGEQGKAGAGEARPLHRLAI